MLVVVVVVVVVGRAAAAAVGGGGSGLTEPGSYTACFLHLVMKWINSGWNGTLSMRCVCACERACTLQTSFCNCDKEWDRSRGVVVNGMIILKVMLEKVRLWEFSGCLRWRRWLISESFNNMEHLVTSVSVCRHSRGCSPLTSWVLAASQKSHVLCWELFPLCCAAFIHRMSICVTQTAHARSAVRAFSDH